MATLKVVAAHAILYALTYWTLNFVEDSLTASGTVAFTLLGLTVPLSFFSSLWAVGGLPRPSARDLGHAAVIALLLSPFSLVMWLTVFVNIVGYRG